MGRKKKDHGLQRKEMENSGGFSNTATVIIGCKVNNVIEFST